MNKKTGPRDTGLRNLEVRNKHTFDSIPKFPSQAADALSVNFTTKNSHEFFVAAVEGEVIRVALWRGDGRGGFRPTPNGLAFNRRHLPKIRALLAGLEGAQ